MKKNAIQLSALLLGALLLPGGTDLKAQTAPNPDDTGAQAVRAQQATTGNPVSSPSPTVVPIEPASIIPPNTLPGPGAGTLPTIPGGPEIQQLNALFKQTSLGKLGDEHRLHVQMSELEVQMRNDQELHRLRAAADETHTDLERRHRFRTYYERYYGKLLARAQTPELKEYVKAQKAGHELTLLQPRVRHETDEAEATKLAAAKTGTAATPLSTPTQTKVDDILQQ